MSKKHKKKKSINWQDIAINAVTDFFISLIVTIIGIIIEKLIS